MPVPPTIARAWQGVADGSRRGPLAAAGRLALSAATVPYAVGVSLRNRRYDKGIGVVRAGVPVVSVGNLSMGGTGKTPCVEYVARKLAERGRAVAVLSRGYGSDAGRNDEALVLEENLPDVPHLQGADRAALAATAVEELECDALVLDDGFQHRRLYRDLDIVLIDATRPPYEDNLFPRGSLRETVQSLKRAQVVILTRVDQVGDLDADLVDMSLLPRHGREHLTVAHSVHRPKEWLATDAEPEPPEAARGRSVGMLCGVGNPAAFERTLVSLGAEVVGRRIEPDHAAYTRESVAEIARWAAALPPGAEVACTQKDWVKLRTPELGGRRLRALRIGLEITRGEPELLAALDGCLA